MTEFAPDPALRAKTRIQRENEEKILDAALEVFSAEGFRGSTIDRIAQEAGMSKPNLLYYFRSKEEIYRAVLDATLDGWLDPLRRMDPAGEPLEEIRAYLRRKLEMSRENPRASRLFANEVIRGAPLIVEELTGALKALVDEKAAVIEGWIAAGRLAPVDPRHLLFAIWATTQHYADFQVQVQAVLSADAGAAIDGAQGFLDTLFLRALAPG
ncbi:TetR family transcriptional regulator [Paroceanicella profunda]|uniref:TetR family transcriptional regulator n=1 Tax=Paroceanicella profunda TaxID=2579971 RepID=A0A5B8G2A9_9RHOB|nr:TetR family transcriptional regulator C-terminal domain-containing protein [Paroceanicella profunda]QDL93449.1 TetR family transcriptional regulator [Paroceanicella profunda]